MQRRPIDKSLRERAEKVIPNGIYGHESVRMLPASYSQFIAKADGAYIWDADGNRYIDMMCAYGPNLLGYKNEKVDAAAVAQLQMGDAMTGPSPLMVDLAETFEVAHSLASQRKRAARKPPIPFNNWLRCYPAIFRT